MSPAVRSELEECGTLLRLTLDRPKGNVLDSEMIAELREEISRARTWAPVRTLLFTGEGRQLSELHLPDPSEHHRARPQRVL